jgi:hypothetical protein
LSSQRLKTRGGGKEGERVGWTAKEAKQWKKKACELYRLHKSKVVFGEDRVGLDGPGQVGGSGGSSGQVVVEEWRSEDSSSGL